SRRASGKARGASPGASPAPGPRGDPPASLGWTRETGKGAGRHRGVERPGTPEERPDDPPPEPETGMTSGPKALGVERLSDVWSRRKWPALLAFTAVLAGGGGLTAGLPDLYQATATIRVDPPPGTAPPSSADVEPRLP